MAMTGIFVILALTVVHSAAELVYLEENRILAFRVTAGTNSQIFHQYMSGDDDYRSPILDQWPSGLIDTVRVSVYENSREMAWLEFDGRGSDSTNWFSNDKLLRSSWDDVGDYSHNYFSVRGDDTHNHGNIGRRFFINQYYRGCPRDEGWLVVLERADNCEWSEFDNYPVILYSKLTTKANWNSASAIGRADGLAVIVKMRDDVTLNHQCWPSQ